MTKAGNIGRRHKFIRRQKSSLEVLQSTILLDPVWYRESHADLRGTGIDAAKHYLEHGAREGRNPHPLFDTNWYLRHTPEAGASGVNPLVHYLQREDYAVSYPHPLFNAKAYLAAAPGAASSGLDPVTHYLTTGWKQGIRPSDYFDPKLYLERNPDVKTAGAEPLSHFLQWGWRENRWPNASFDPVTYRARWNLTESTNPLLHFALNGGEQPERNSKSADSVSDSPTTGDIPSALRCFDLSDPLRILFVSGDSASPSHAYRVANLARGLQSIGCKTETVSLHELGRVTDRVAEFHVAVFWRIAIGPRFSWSTETERFVAACESQGVAVFFDIDDLVFAPEITNVRFIDGLRYLSAEQLVQHMDGVHGYRTMMLRCGNVLVPTEALKQQVEKCGGRAFVVPNGLLESYEEALSWPLVQPERATVVVGYAPGSRTHQKDFAAAEPALRRLLESRSDVQLRIMGHLDLSEFPALQAHLGSRVFLDKAGPLAKVFWFNQQIDINLAPLELENPYTAAKSELKYFEAAVFGVPTVASKVGPHRQCIKNGENGYAVETEAEWFAALAALVDDRDLRHKIGAAARAHVQRHYTATILARQMIKAFEQVREDLRASSSGQQSQAGAHSDEVWPDIRDYRSDRPIVINWLVPGLIIGGGGHRNILRAAYHLGRFGHRVRLYFTNTDMPVREVQKLVREHFYPINCPMEVYNGSMKPADVVFATYWATVPIALQHRNICPNAFYFVQDFEPAFFPMGSGYILAENTYRQGLYAICSGAWCAHFLRTQFNASADSFSFPIEKIYHPRRRNKNNTNILFFAKPDMPRRCFELGVEVLKEVHALRGDIEIITFGSRQVTQEKLPFPATCNGLLPSVVDLAKMYSDADLGIVFSPTNPSLVPYEMLACGLPVVDLDRPGAEINYGGRRDIVLLGNPVPSDMARQIMNLLEDPTERTRRSREGLELVANFPDETGMARRIESLIVQRLLTVGAIAAEKPHS
jgi:glycosyltransferase involved in cell wall biosynthesis